jgi:hypothetical protein
MRITISPDKDVAARLDRLRKTRRFKDLVNEALRAGLDKIENKYSINPVKGHPVRTDLGNVAEVIADVEGERFR